MIQDAIESIVAGKSLTMDQSASVMNEIMTGQATPAQFGAFVTALRIKGETSEEIAGMASTMRDKSLRVSVEGPLVDTCGTGGDASGTFNISTTAGFVVAGAGVKVAKHGNRAMSGACGSADILEGLGIKIELGPEGVARCLDEVGFGFMFAQSFHPSMKFAAGPRREIGIRTVFNILGPLTNPASAKAQLIGVADPAVGARIAEVLGKLGSSHALVVHGLDGLDEVSLGDTTQVWEFRNSGVREYAITPEELGLPRVYKKDIKVGSIEESVTTLRRVLAGDHFPAREVVLANASAALFAADVVPTIMDGIKLAAESIDSGAAKQKMEDLASLSQNLG